MQPRHFLNEHAVIDIGNQFCLRLGAWCNLHGQTADTWRTSEPAAGGIARAGGLHATGAVRRLHEHLQHTVFDQHVAPCGETFAIDIRGGVSQLVRRVIHECKKRHGHLFAEALGKNTATF